MKFNNTKDPLLPNIKEAMYSIIKSFRDSGAGDLSLLSGTVRVCAYLFGATDCPRS